MTAEGHLLFSIAFSAFAKNASLTSVLAEGDWWHIIPSAILTCLIPDIDHPQSLLGQRLKWISKPISKIFGHRGFTHSLLIIFIILILYYLKIIGNLIFPSDVIQGMVLGYISHIVADILTPAGVPLLWPYRLRFRFPILTFKKNNQLERVFCIIFFFLAIFVPQNLSESNIVYLLSNIINF